MILELHTSQKESVYTYTTSLDGVTYRLSFLWNERSDHWFMTLTAPDGDDVWTGVKMVADVPVRVRETDPDRPAGQIWVLDDTGHGNDPGLMDFGLNTVLLYVDSNGYA